MLREDKRRELLDNFMRKHEYDESALLEILHKTQEIYGYLDNESLMYVAQSLNLPPSHVYGVATFYSFFKLKAAGEHVVTGCLGTACYVKGVEEIMQAVEREFNVKRGESTADGKLSLFVTRCIGACAMAPSVVIDGEVMGKATPELVINKLKLLLGGNKTETR
ncbi:MAG: NAD(P)H-dependent oxidoreductase subunit E [Candidatus Bathyarchaeota archaeon]|nr:NAD(P)H-dependent oxidoreductase subunit E [Candidatus Bathyarchaeota archaeon]